MPSAENTRIAKNTLYLYLRMVVTIAVNLYAIRVVWRVLGVDDYGIYNVVGGIVTMFAFLNSAMVASSQRFISYELGGGNLDRLKRVFSLSVTVHIMLAILVLILAETVGLWFLNDRLNIPPDRMSAANWVYQCSIMSFMLTIVSVPYNACIVAHEHMKAYGYFGILEVILKLVIVFLLMALPFDKLITYSVLLLSVAFLMRVIYGIYCTRHFTECRYKYVTDHHLMRDMFSFAGWSFLGNLGFSVRNQGLNIVLNLFFNVAVNAAKGVSNQIGGVINGFTQSFQMALNPQITKRYAAGDHQSMMSLVFSGCKFSGLLMNLMVVPVYFASEAILKLWLGDIAPYTVGFLKLVLILALVESLVNPITTALQATGRIKWFQIWISIIMVSTIPLSWLWLKFDLDPYIVLYISIISSVIGVAARLILLHREVSYSYKAYLLRVIAPLIPTSLISFLVAWLLWGVFSENLMGLIGYAIVTLFVIGVITFIAALNKGEREFILEAVRKKLKG